MIQTMDVIHITNTGHQKLTDDEKKKLVFIVGIHALITAIRSNDKQQQYNCFMVV